MDGHHIFKDSHGQTSRKRDDSRQNFDNFYNTRKFVYI